MPGLELTGLEGKVAVVTGAGRMRSIGRSIAVRMAEAGCDVVITGTGRDPSRYPDDEKAAGWRDIDSVADEIRALGRRALAVVSDVRDPDAVEALAQQTMAELGRVDFVINNAGPARGDDRAPVTEVPLDAWHNVHNINLNGAFYMCRAFGKRLIEQDEGGAIINISSIGSKLMLPNNAAYATSKAALNALTATMAGEVGQYKIRVNAICPGLVDTSRMDDMPRGNADADAEALTGTVGASFDAFVENMIPLKRAGQGVDIANMTVYLCSEQGAWTTGQCINVDGGTVVGH